MNFSSVKKAFRIFRQRGSAEFCNVFTKFILNQLDPQYHRRFKFHTWKNHLHNRLRYSAPPNPYRRIVIKPADINFRLRRKNNSMVIPKVKNGGIGRVRGGNWDTHRKGIEDPCDMRGAIIKGIRQKYKDKLDWEETDYYKIAVSQYKDKYKDKIKKTEYSSVDEYLLHRMRSYEELYHDISENGYSVNHRETSARPGDTEPVESRLEVLVTIDRSGAIYLFGGYHRFGISRVLDIRIPAQVVCRHEQWQRFRDDVHSKGLHRKYSNISDHPDLQDITS